ncbi:MAG: hypothetical protein NXI04_13225 [Planctomycetaceae bacterium]|nr:hypothetical protein [Planctomycetaceae bacterium]
MTEAPRKSGRQATAVGAALGAIMVVTCAISVCCPSKTSGAKRLLSAAFTITAGQLHPVSEFETVDGRRIVRVVAGQPVHIEIASEDFVYTVEQQQTQRAVVVLPGGVSSMDVQLAKGLWPLRIIQGCGQLSREHEQEVFLLAAGSR